MTHAYGSSHVRRRKRVSMSSKATRKIAIGAAALALTAAAVITPVAMTEEGPFAAFTNASYQSDAQGWPSVDWEALQAENPDVCAWITIPGTTIDHPIVQASSDAPDYYLKHDLSGEYDSWGTPYLEAECAERGILSSKAAFVYGHNMLDGSQFEPLVDYVDESFMDEHRKVWVQTPDGQKHSYDVFAATVVGAGERLKRTDFKNSADFASWRDMYYVNAEAVSSHTSPSWASRVLCLSTCSHHGLYKNERTVVWCMPSKDARDGGVKHG